MTVKILPGDCREVLKTLPDGSVNCCVTSPPYWGLRDYGTAKWEGGDAECDHRPHREVPAKGTTESRPSMASEGIQRETCRICGARRIDFQLGLEPTPEKYVARMVEVFREVRRVLRDDGTLWLNLGDSYAGGGRAGKEGIQKWGGIEKSDERKYGPPQEIPSGLKPKDLVGIPWRVAFALQADGWWLRSDIIYAKPNPMPESVTDRPTKAHEYVFLMSKAQVYYYDAEAIKEPSATGDPRPPHGPGQESIGGRPASGRKQPRFGGNKYPDAGSDGPYSGNEYVPNGRRNRRSVWSIPSDPYSGAHFATFPRALVLPCILAGCPQGGTVLDPFGGSGTTGEVAEQNGRHSILIELSPEYVKLAEKRTAQMGLFAGTRYSHNKLEDYDEMPRV